jgi:hypothetical protein
MELLLSVLLSRSHPYSKIEKAGNAPFRERMRSKSRLIEHDC